MEHFESIESFRLQEIEGFLQPLEASQTLQRMGEESAPSGLMHEADELGAWLAGLAARRSFRPAGRTP